MSLLDPDRFEGRFRDGVHVVDVSDLMRLRQVLGTPLGAMGPVPAYRPL